MQVSNSFSDNEQMENDSISSEDDELKGNKWNLECCKEKLCRNRCVIGDYIYDTKTCRKCKYKSLVLKESENEDILNPYYVKCSKTFCRRRYNLRYFSFFRHIRKSLFQFLYLL